MWKSDLQPVWYDKSLTYACYDDKTDSMQRFLRLLDAEMQTAFGGLEIHLHPNHTISVSPCANVPVDGLSNVRAVARPRRSHPLASFGRFIAPWEIFHEV